MRWCRTCLMPDTRPRVVFTDGICNACRFAEQYKRTDWAERKKEFLDVVAAHKKHPAYDCIVPFSGGKDSASIAHRLKHELGLNPLLVCYGQLIWTDVGRRNLHRVCDSGFDIFYWRTNQRVSRNLARRFFVERGHPKQHYDAAVNSVPVITALQFDIPLIIYAEHGESFYGGHILSEEHRRKRDLAEVLEHQVGDDARNWATAGITERDLFPYIYPDAGTVRRAGIEAHYYSYYFPWDIYDNAAYSREVMGFEQAPDWRHEMIEPVFTGEYEWIDEGEDEAQQREKVLFRRRDLNPEWWGKSDGSFEGFDSIDDCIDDLDYWMMYLKFGFGRSARMASRLIQMGHMTREQGLELVRRYDGEEPVRYRQQISDYLGMSWDEIRAVADTHRNPEIWDKQGNEWKLRNPPA